MFHLKWVPFSLELVWVNFIQMVPNRDIGHPCLKSNTSSSPLEFPLPSFLWWVTQVTNLGMVFSLFLSYCLSQSWKCVIYLFVTSTTHNGNCHVSLIHILHLHPNFKLMHRCLRFVSASVPLVTVFFLDIPSFYFPFIPRPLHDFYF